MIPGGIGMPQRPDHMGTRHRAAFCSNGYSLNAYQLKGTRGVPALTSLDFKPEGDRLLHPFDQLIN